jgi:hypothetical protein
MDLTANTVGLLPRTIEKFWETVPPAWNAIRAFIRETAARDFDITVEQFHILRHVAKGSGSISELAQAKHISRPAISQAVDMLVNKGLLTRCQDERDRRFVKLELAARLPGLAAHRHARPAADDRQPDPDVQHQPQPGAHHPAAAAGHLSGDRAVQHQDGAAVCQRAAEAGPPEHGAAGEYRRGAPGQGLRARRAGGQRFEARQRRLHRSQRAGDDLDVDHAPVLMFLVNIGIVTVIYAGGLMTMRGT